MSLGAQELYGPKDKNHVKVSDIKIHPKFNSPITNDSFAYDHDFAILTLEKPVTFNEKIQQVCLPKDTETVLEGRGAKTTGWGGYNPDKSSQPRSLQVANLLIGSNALCYRFHSWLYSYSYVINDRKICADLDDDKYDPCKVDSGGPLIITGNKQ